LFWREAPLTAGAFFLNFVNINYMTDSKEDEKKKIEELEAQMSCPGTL